MSEEAYGEYKKLGDDRQINYNEKIVKVKQLEEYLKLNKLDTYLKQLKDIRENENMKGGPAVYRPCHMINEAEVCKIDVCMFYFILFLNIG
ncbi:unnamed protein product [Meloidogyne enterolobii]|uniref:Uncharacterized protein n=1 Tax=Meloidogyne enterolobii TaxID=390850 RepID=A0ACB0YAX0_MELEN